MQTGWHCCSKYTWPESSLKAWKSVLRASRSPQGGKVYWGNLHGLCLFISGKGDCSFLVCLLCLQGRFPWGILCTSASPSSPGSWGLAISLLLSGNCIAEIWLIYPDVGSLQAVPFPGFWEGTDALCAWQYTENKKGFIGGETGIHITNGRNSQNRYFNYPKKKRCYSNLWIWNLPAVFNFMTHVSFWMDCGHPSTFYSQYLLCGVPLSCESLQEW